MNTGSPSTSSAMPLLLAEMKASSFFGSSEETQRASEYSLTSNSTGSEYSASSRALSTSSCNGPTTPTSAGAPSRGRNTWTTPSSDICCRASFSFFAFGERVADAERAVVGNADDVAGIGLVRDRAVLGEEELRACQRHALAGAHELRLHAAAELAGTQPREGDAVAVVRIHVGLDLEHEGAHARLGRL